MILTGLLVVLAVQTLAQNTDDDVRAAINNIFTTPDTSFLNQYEVISSTTQDSFGALDKCGEGQNEGVNICVPYYNCDAETKMIVVDGSSDGFGVIDIRFNSNTCDHYLDTCCGIPESGLPPDFNATQPPPTAPPTRPPTRPPIDVPGGSQTIPPPVQQGGLCGVRNEKGLDFTITGNTHGEAEYAEFPWMVAVIKNPEFISCGGSLITYNVVITAAHCVHNVKTSGVRVRAGEWDTQTTKERLPYQERNVQEIIIRNDFNSKVVFNDVALLILETPIIPADNIGTICLPPQDTVANSKNCYASGWGQKVFGSRGNLSNILKKIELSTVNFAQCQNDLRKTRLGNRFTLHKSFMCAGGDSEDTCTGDGGSPLVCPNPIKPGRYFLTGLVAWGIGCGQKGVPGVYADVAKFRNWIDQELQRRNISPETYIA